MSVSPDSAAPLVSVCVCLAARCLPSPPGGPEKLSEAAHSGPRRWSPSTPRAKTAADRLLYARSVALVPARIEIIRVLRRCCSSANGQEDMPRHACSSLPCLLLDSLFVSSLPLRCLCSSLWGRDSSRTRVPLDDRRTHGVETNEGQGNTKRTRREHGTPEAEAATGREGEQWKAGRTARSGYRSSGGRETRHDARKCTRHSGVAALCVAPQLPLLCSPTGYPPPSPSCMHTPPCTPVHPLCPIMITQ